MNPQEFLKTIYLGDRSLQSLNVQPWNQRIEIQVDCLSRVRSLSGSWEYYSAEDINNGKIVFTGVKSLRFEPSGPIPNDAIDHLSVIRLDIGNQYEFEFAVESVSPDGISVLVKILIVATAVHLEDPEKPNIEIIK